VWFPVHFTPVENDCGQVGDLENNFLQCTRQKNCQSIAMPVKKYLILDKFYPTCKSKKNVTKAAADH
jgi:hypothetical protein